MWYTHAPPPFASKSSASPTSNHDTTGSFSLHPRPYIPSIRVRPAGQVLPACLRCIRNHGWLFLLSRDMLLAAAATYHPFSPLFKYFSFFPWSESLQAARRTHTRVAGWGGSSSIKSPSIFHFRVGNTVISAFPKSNIFLRHYQVYIFIINLQRKFPCFQIAFFISRSITN